MTMIEFINKVNGEVPWNRGTWSGKFYSFDGTPASDFGPQDVARVLAADNSGEGWDGHAAAVIQLKDDRWVAWESTWGPTGSGFSEDAYGGDANVYFSYDLANCIRYGLTTEGRELLDLKNLNDPTVFTFENIEIKGDSDVS